MVLPLYRTVGFVHWCFWHRHAGCKVATTPKSNTGFWIEKFDRNVARDSRSRELLETQGWKVIIVWECELGSGRKAADAALRVAAEIRPDVPGKVDGGTSEYLTPGTIFAESLDPSAGNHLIQADQLVGKEGGQSVHI